ncbi:hypothetical protein [Plantactinospora sp. BC1]|uniref:hypothetical protein n=1 Tax=Plantactinospora sp. BC1 TaxID=2108470 RepID=UPI00131EDC25|nr:hypothetical protein [Plantactinospora sp. BC1]
MTFSDSRDPEVVEMSEEEEQDYVRSECVRLLGVDLEEFTRRWYAGEYRDHDDPKVTQVAMLLPDVG